MRSPRREDAFVLVFVTVSVMVMIVGGAYIIWYSLDRYSLGATGGALGAAWAISWLGVLRDTVRAILADDGPMCAIAHKPRGGAW